MPRELDSSFFDNFDHTPYDELVAEGSILPEPVPGKGLAAVAEYLQDRSEMFQKMTSGKGKPMIYGAMKKDKR